METQKVFIHVHSSYYFTTFEYLMCEQGHSDEHCDPWAFRFFFLCFYIPLEGYSFVAKSQVHSTEHTQFQKNMLKSCGFRDSSDMLGVYLYVLVRIKRLHM